MTFVMTKKSIYVTIQNQSDSKMFLIWKHLVSHIIIMQFSQTKTIFCFPQLQWHLMGNKNNITEIHYDDLCR